MAEWHRVRLERRQVLVVEAGDIEVTVYGEGRVRVASADAHLQPSWRKPPLARLTRLSRDEAEALDTGDRGDGTRR